jgi:hypothetical protein
MKYSHFFPLSYSLTSLICKFQIINFILISVSTMVIMLIMNVYENNNINNNSNNNKCKNIISFPLALHPKSGLGRLNEIFRFISVSRTKTVGRTPWTGD